MGPDCTVGLGLSKPCQMISCWKPCRKQTCRFFWHGAHPVSARVSLETMDRAIWQSTTGIISPKRWDAGGGSLAKTPLGPGIAMACAGSRLWYRREYSFRGGGQEMDRPGCGKRRLIKIADFSYQCRLLSRYLSAPHERKDRKPYHGFLTGLDRRSWIL